MTQKITFKARMAGPIRPRPEPSFHDNRAAQKRYDDIMWSLRSRIRAALGRGRDR